MNIIVTALVLYIVYIIYKCLNHPAKHNDWADDLFEIGVPVAFVCMIVANELFGFL